MSKSIFTSHGEPPGEVYGSFSGDWTEESDLFLRENRFRRIVLKGKYPSLSFLGAHAQYLEDVSLANESETTEGFDAIQQVRRLDLQSRTRKPILFQEMRQLEECRVTWKKEYSSAESLIQLPKLKRLVISSFSEEDFSCWGSSNVERLQLLRADCRSMAGIESCSKLVELDIADAGKLLDLVGLDKLPKLRKVTIRGAKLLQTVAPLGKCAGLQEVGIAATGLVHDAHKLENLKTLRKLKVLGPPLAINWTAMVENHGLRFIAITVSKNYLPTRQQVEELASKVQCQIVRYEVSGTKATPLLQLELAEKGL